MHKRTTSKPLGVLDRRVPKTDKYSHISGHLDTGLTANKVKFVSVREFNRRRDEIYYRVNKDMLASLFQEYEGESERFGARNAGVFGGGGPTIITHSEVAKPDYNRPYLLIDCRYAITEISRTQTIFQHFTWTILTSLSISTFSICFACSNTSLERKWHMIEVALLKLVHSLIHCCCATSCILRCINSATKKNPSLLYTVKMNRFLDRLARFLLIEASIMCSY